MRACMFCAEDCKDRGQMWGDGEMSRTGMYSIKLTNQWNILEKKKKEKREKKKRKIQTWRNHQRKYCWFSIVHPSISPMCIKQRDSQKLYNTKQTLVPATKQCTTVMGQGWTGDCFNHALQNCFLTNCRKVFNPLECKTEGFCPTANATFQSDSNQSFPNWLWISEGDLLKLSLALCGLTTKTEGKGLGQKYK